MILCLSFMLSLAVSCSHDSDLRSTLDAAGKKFFSKEYDASQAELLKAEAMMDSDTPLSYREELERMKGINYLELRVMDKAKMSLQKALEYSKQMDDTSLIIQNSFNLGLCDNTVDEVTSLYRDVIALAENHQPMLVPQALEKLAQGYIYGNDFENAQRTLDRASRLVGGTGPMCQEIAFTQCELWLAEDSLEWALEGFKSIPADSCSIIGKLNRSAHIYNILYQLGDYKGALAYKDSLHQFTDSIKSIKGATRIERIEEEYRQNVNKERERFNTLLYASSCGLLVIALVMYFVLKSLRMKRMQVSLTNRIAELNVRLSELQPKDGYEGSPADVSEAEAAQSLVDMRSLIMEKFRLSKEVLTLQPQYQLLRKLNLMHDFDADSRLEIKNVYSEIIGRFSDACASLRQTVPAMTNDDCLMCSMAYCGCSKEVIAAMMGSSEEAVRRRKSRIKQKLPEVLFLFFFK